MARSMFEPIRKISLLKNKAISCIFFCIILPPWVVYRVDGKITVIFFTKANFQLEYLSHARVDWYACAHIAKRLDPTDELYIFLTLRTFFTTNIKDRMRRRYVLYRTGIWTVRRTKL